MPSAALDGWEDALTTPVTPARRGADAALEATTKKARRADVPRVLAASNAELTPAPSVAFDIAAGPACAYAINRAAWEAVASLPAYLVATATCGCCRLVAELQHLPSHNKQPWPVAAAAMQVIAPPQQHPAARPNVCNNCRRCDYDPPPPCRCRIAEKCGCWASMSEPQCNIFQESYMVRCRSHPRWTPCLLSLPLLSCLMRETTACLAPAPGLH